MKLFDNLAPVAVYLVSVPLEAALMGAVCLFLGGSLVNAFRVLRWLLRRWSEALIRFLHGIDNTKLRVRSREVSVPNERKD